MKLSFREEFKNRLSSIGETVILDTYLLAVGGERYKFDSLWNEDKGCLEMTIDLTTVNIQSFTGKITVLCTNLDGKELCTAFEISSDKMDDFSWGRAKNRRDLNYFTVYFPVSVKATVKTRISKENVKFLESKSPVLGYNTFLSELIGDNELLTKQSVFKYANINSLKQLDRSTYLNQNGEKVTEIKARKIYKKLFLSLQGVTGTEDESGNISYQVSREGKYKYTVRAIYDLYKDDNGVISFIKGNCVENVINYVLEGNGTDFIIDYNHETITFNDEKDIVLWAKVEYTGELGDKMWITSNQIQVVTYFDIISEYTTDLHENGKPLFLFDSKEKSTGWNDSNSTSKISIILKKLVPREQIVILADKQEYFNNFEFLILYPELVPSLGGYRYTINITTTQENNSENWLPYNSSSMSSEPGKFYIRIGDVVYPESEFYCVQKGYFPLRLFVGGEYSNEETIYYSGSGVVEVNGGCLNGYEVGYTKWEATIVEGASNTALSRMYGEIAESPTPTKEEHIIDFYFRCGDLSGQSSRVIFRRVNDNLTVDETNWRDLIYCYGDDSWTLVDFVSKSSPLDKTGLNIKCNSPYYYRNDIDEIYPLLVFPRAGKDENITVYSPNQESIEIISNDKEYSKYFDHEVTNGPIAENGMWKSVVKIHANSVNGNPSFNKSGWWPKSGNAPTGFSVKSGNLLKNVYVLFTPELNGTLEFSNRSEQVIKDLAFNPVEGRKEESLVIRTARKDADDYFPGIFCAGIDPEIKIDPSPLTITGNYKLYTDYEPKDTVGKKFDPLRIIRVKGTKYQTHKEVLEDWENQLTQSSLTSLDVSVKGKETRDTIKVYAELDKGRTEVSEEEPIELSYIGLYKIFVKCKGKFRVGITDRTSESEGIYFYNQDTNTVIEDISTRDFGTFSDSIGTEICFSYTGGEIGGFQEKDVFLSTKLTVSNLEDGTVRVIPFHRTYFKEDGSLNLFSAPVGITNNRVFKVGNNYILLENTAADYTSIPIKCYVESGCRLADNLNPNYFAKSGESFYETQYDSYDNIRPGEVLGENGVRTRGYLSTTLREHYYNTITVPERYEFPLKPVLHYEVHGTLIPIASNSELPGEFKNNVLNYKLYTIPVINPIVAPDYINLQSEKGSNREIEIIVDSHALTTIGYCIKEGRVEYTTVIQPNTTTSVNSKVIELGGIPYTVVETILADPDEVTIKVKIKITANEDYVKPGTPEEENKPPLKFLWIKVNTKIQNVGLLEGVDDHVIEDDAIDNISKPQSKTITLWRLGLANSHNTFEDDNVVVHSGGGVYRFLVNKKVSTLPLSWPTELRARSPYVSSIGFSGDVEASPVFSSRLYRNEGENYTGPIYVGIDGKGQVSQTTKNEITAFSTVKDSNFAILVGDMSLPGENILESRNVTQSGWRSGIKSGNLLYLGGNNTIDLGERENNSRIVKITLGSVSLSEDGGLGSDVLGTESIALAPDYSKGSEWSSKNVTSVDFGKTFTIELPENNSVSTVKKGKFLVQNPHGDVITYTYSVKPRNSFSVKLYRDEERRYEIDGRVSKTEDTTPYCLTFSSSGDIVGSSKYLYAETESNDVGGNFSMELVREFDGLYHYLTDNRGLMMSHQAKSVDARFSVNGSLLKKLPNGNYLYRLFITGRIMGIDGEVEFMRRPYQFTSRLVLLGSNGVLASHLIPDTRFGSASLRISPVQCYKSVQYWSEDLQSDKSETKYYPLFNRGYEDSSIYDPYVPNYIDPTAGLIWSNSGSSNVTGEINCSVKRGHEGDFFNVGLRLFPKQDEWECREETIVTYPEGANLDLHLVGPEELHIYYGNKLDYNIEMTKDSDGGKEGIHTETIITKGKILDGNYEVYASNRNNGVIKNGIPVTASFQISGKIYDLRLKEIPTFRTPILKFKVVGGSVEQISIRPAEGVDMTNRPSTPLYVGFSVGLNWTIDKPTPITTREYRWLTRSVLDGEISLTNLSTTLCDLVVPKETKSNVKIYADNLEGEKKPTSRKYLKTKEIRDIVNSKDVETCPYTDTLEQLSSIKENNVVAVKGETPFMGQLHISPADLIGNSVSLRYSLATDRYGRNDFKFTITIVNNGAILGQTERLRRIYNKN